MVSGILIFKNKGLGGFEKIMEEEDIKNYISYVKKNSGYKRIRYKLLKFQ